MKRVTIPHVGSKVLSPIAVLAILAFPTAAAATSITFAASGPDAPAIQATVDAFRVAISAGGVNNGNGTGSASNGRREISWDGGGVAALATVFPSPMNTFNSGGTPRGAVFITPGLGFEISGQPSPEFGDINPTYPAIFQTFSSPRLFTSLGSNVVDALFFVPGTSTRATVSGFGAVFTDVDLANGSTLQFFDLANVSLGTFSVPVFNNGLSFLGLSFTDASIGRVRITSGTTALGPNDGGGIDVVALDDFIYSEPQDVVPEPATLVLFGTGIAAALARRRRPQTKDRTR
jgi:hypothetical protein